MITKEQAMNADYFRTIEQFSINKPLNTHFKPHNYRRNGKTKTWKSKSRINEFSIPVKRGLREYGYITQDNAHLFEVAQ